MPIQTEYPSRIPQGLEGALANNEPKTLISRVATEEIGFGVPVVASTGDKTVRNFASGDTAIVGVTVRDRSVDPSAPNSFREGDNVRVLKEGVIFVTVSTAVTAESEAFIAADGTFADAGLAIDRGSYDTSGNAGDIVTLRIR